MSVNILLGDCRQRLRELPEQSVHACVTSPPYFGLRDYGVDGQIGLEQTPDAFVAELVDVFREVRRVLRDDGTLWLNLGDSYARNGGDGGCGPNAQVGSTKLNVQKRVCIAPSGYKPKDLIGIPWMVAFALRADGWYLRSDIIWHKPNVMPESVTDRPTKAHEYVFLLTKSDRYYFDADAVREQRSDDRVCPTWDERKENGAGSGNREPGRWKPERAGAGVGANPKGRNVRSVWTVATHPFAGAHFATFPPDLIEPCIKAGCPADGTVLDPFFGAGTTGLVAQRLGRNAIGIELNPEYAALAKKRLDDDAGIFSDVRLAA